MGGYLSLAEAESLFDQLRENFSSLTKTIERIIETRAWEVLGYASFAAAWRANFSGIPLRTDVEKLLVISAMAETETADDIAAAVPGVGPGTVERVFDRLQMGLNAQQISLAKCSKDEVYVGPFVRRRPGAPRRVHLELGEEKYQALISACRRQNISTKQFLNEAISARLEVLARGERVA